MNYRDIEAMDTEDHYDYVVAAQSHESMGLDGLRGFYHHCYELRQRVSHTTSALWIANRIKF